MKKSTHWVTIPEEILHTPASLSDRQAGTAGKKAETRSTQTRPGEVQHKFFWGVGFVVVMIASFAVLAPQQFGSILQGNLFDAPGVTAPDLSQGVGSLGVLPSGVSSAPAPSADESTSSGNQTVIQPETAPVSVQVTPLAPAAPDSGAPAELDANQKLIQELQKQVADLKSQQQTTVSVTPPVPGVPGIPLPGLTFSLPTDLRSAAPEAASATATFGQTATSPEGYRLNSHRVSVSPQVVLEQYSRGGYRVPASSTSFIPATTTPAYRADFGGVRGTPDSGPKEVLLFTLILTFAGLLVYKAVRLRRS
ncbi:MAG: hypothetical protein V1908_01605 [Candidatus Peregrinibacteria bacterium]